MRLHLVVVGLISVIVIAGVTIWLLRDSSSGLLAVNGWLFEVQSTNGTEYFFVTYMVKQVYFEPPDVLSEQEVQNLTGIDKVYPENTITVWSSEKAIEIVAEKALQNNTDGLHFRASAAYITDDSGSELMLWKWIVGVFDENDNFVRAYGVPDGESDPWVGAPGMYQWDWDKELFEDRLQKWLGENNSEGRIKDAFYVYYIIPPRNIVESAQTAAENSVV